MFVAFWFSFISLILLGAAVACVSTDPDNIKNVPFFTGVLTVDKADGTTAELDVYAGLKRVVIEGCDLGAQCPPQTTAWDSVNCDQYFNNCNACADASLGSVTMVIMSFVTQIPQCTGDLGRSMGELFYELSSYRRCFVSHVVVFFVARGYIFTNSQSNTIFTVRKRKFHALLLQLSNNKL